MGDEESLYDDWTDIDRTADPGEFVSYLDDVSALEQARAYKRQTFALLEPRDGSHLLEVGCGTGDDAIALAALVGETGQVVGIDHSATMIAVAQQRAAGLGVPVRFAVGDAHRLDFAEATFDGCRSDRTFQHLAHPAQALAELVRVARSGAAVVVADPDWETLLVDAPDYEVTRQIVEASLTETLNGRMGRELPRLFHRAGLVDLKVIPVTVTFGDYATADQVLGLAAALEQVLASGAVSAVAADEWASGLQAADQAGEFFGAISGFIVKGRKP